MQYPFSSNYIIPSSYIKIKCVLSTAIIDWVSCNVITYSGRCIFSIHHPDSFHQHSPFASMQMCTAFCLWQWRCTDAFLSYYTWRTSTCLSIEDASSPITAGICWIFLLKIKKEITFLSSILLCDYTKNQLLSSDTFCATFVFVHTNFSN